MQAEFRRSIYLERRRSERSGRPFLLILLNAESIAEPGPRAAALAAILAALPAWVRETDRLGWYTTASVLGLLFSEVETGDSGLRQSLVRKVRMAVSAAVSASAAGAVQVTAHLFPQPAHEGVGDHDFSCYPELAQQKAGQGVKSVLKRADRKSVV